MCRVESRKAWNTFLDRMSAACRDLEDTKPDFYEPWFRGHVDIDYELKPQLFRGYPDPKFLETERDRRRSSVSRRVRLRRR